MKKNMRKNKDNSYYNQPKFNINKHQMEDEQ